MRQTSAAIALRDAVLKEKIVGAKSEKAERRKRAGLFTVDLSTGRSGTDRATMRIDGTGGVKRTMKDKHCS